MDGKLSGRKLARFGVVIAAALAVAGFSGTASAAAPKAQPLAVSNLGFATSQVDASQNGASVAVNWTVTDTDPAATNVVGTIQFQMAGERPGSYVGQTYTVDYGLNSSSLYGQATYLSGNAASANYTYNFYVPKFAGSTTAHWLINKFTISDDQQNALTVTARQLQAYASNLTATETVDTGKATSDTPTYRTFQVNQLPDLYAGVPNTAYYSFTVQEGNSGFWKGNITISGPGGATLTSQEFSMSTLDGQVSTFPCQGFSSTTEASCTIGIPVPQGTAPGVWSVSQLKLTSNAGVTATYANLNAAPITITDDTGFTASSFSVSQNPVNSWRGAQTVNFSLTPSGAQQGVSAIYVNTYSVTGYCQQMSTTPTVNADGSLSVPLRFDPNTPSCPIAGVVVVDGAGEVALYGSDYNAPDPGITINRTPDTTPPSVSAVSVSPASLPQSALPNTRPTVTAQAAIGVAPLDQYQVLVYDSSGNQVPSSGGIGGVTQAADGSVAISVYLSSGLAPGTYTIGFELWDAGNLGTAYGTPQGQPMPGGPLQVTVTAS